MANSVCCSINEGLIVGWACDTANVADNTFQWLIRQCEEQMIVLSDTGFHAAAGNPRISNCVSAKWEDRMLVETVLSMLTLVCHLKGDASGLGVFSGAPRVHHGLQCAGPVARPPARIWLRAPLDR